MQPPAFTQWIRWNSSVKQTENGEINYYYALLTPLKDTLPKEPAVQMDLSNKAKMAEVSRLYDMDVKRMVYTVVHLDLRHLWFTGVKMVDEIEHFLPGIGTRHRHVLKNGKTVTKYVSSFVYDPEALTIVSETDEKTKYSIYFRVEKNGEHSTKVTIELYIPKNKINEILFNLFSKKKTQQEFLQSLEHLDKVARETIIPLEF
jgi:hypothetical protein